MCVLLWALTDGAVHVLMFSSCFTAELRISQRRHRRIAHPEQYFCVIRQIGTLSSVEIRDLCTV